MRTIALTDEQRHQVQSALSYLAENNPEEDLVSIWETSREELGSTRALFD